MFEATAIEPQSGRENLEMLARLLGFGRGAARSRAHELLVQFDLVDAADRRVAAYSGGMRRRLDLAASLIGRPDLVFLDESTTRLDPRSRPALWDVVAGLAASGITVFLSSVRSGCRGATSTPCSPHSRRR